MDDAESDVLAYLASSKEHRAKLHSTNPIERMNGEIKRRIEVVGFFPNEAAITRLIGAIFMEQSDEWAVQRGRFISLEIMPPVSDSPIVMLSAVPWRMTVSNRCRTGVGPISDTTSRDATGSSMGCD